MATSASSGAADAARRARELVDAALDLLDSADVSTCGYAELDVLTGAVQQITGYGAAHLLPIARRRTELDDAGRAALDALAGAATGGPAPEAGPPPTPSTNGGEPLDLSGFGDVRDRRPGRESELDRWRAVVGAAMPAMEAALTAGRISTAHLDAVVATWRDLDDEERQRFAGHGDVLTASACAESVERFRRRVRDLARRLMRDQGQRVAERQRAAANVRRWIDAAGMGHLHAELDPVATAKVWAALDEHLARLKDREGNAGVKLTRLEVDAFVELVSSSTRLDPRAPELVVLVDLTTLTSGRIGPGGVCETSDGVALAPETVRRLACEAGILPCVLDGAGVPVDVGRSQRLATKAQRRALAAMYATCAMPGCDVRFERCRIHHAVPWFPIGPTDLDNLVHPKTHHAEEPTQSTCTTL